MQHQSNHFKRSVCPRSLHLIPNQIPPELRDRPQWVAWTYRWRAGTTKPAKVPIDPHTGRGAKSNNSRTWGPIDAALAIAQQRDLAGIGFMFSPDGPFAGVDLDGCRSASTGQLDPWAEEIVAALNTYAEVSPSLTGVKAFVQGQVPGVRHRKGKVELYDRGRFFAVTGLRLDTAPADVRPSQPALDALYRELFDKELFTAKPPQLSQMGQLHVALPDAALIRRACAARNGAKFARLWSGDCSGYVSHSEADLALAQLLAFWAGPDLARIDALFRQSRLMRPKWDERHYSDGRTYGQATVQRAAETCRAVVRGAVVFSPRTASNPPHPQEKKLCTRSVSPRRPRGVDALVAHVRRLRLAHGRPIALSCREAGALLGTSYKTAARCFTSAVKAGLLVRVSVGTDETRLASEYDLPEFAAAQVSQHQTVAAPGPSPSESSTSVRPTSPPPYARTPGGLVAVWHWSVRQGRWQHFGDCTDLATANAVAGRHMARRAGWWAVGDELRRYARGRGMRVLRKAAT